MTETVSELVRAVDRLVQIHDAWIADATKTENVPPEPFVAFCEELFQIANRCDVRGSERRLLATVCDFERASNVWTSGMQTRPNGEPPAQYWDFLRQVMHERRLSRDLIVRRPESVATLRRQKVSDVQIATQIYGHRGVGPFLDADGRILHDLLDKEEKEPGSVVPADWVHPTEAERFAAHHVTIGAKQALVEPDDGKSRQGPPTVEGMLRDGASIEQISNKCGVTEKQVKTIAKVLDIASEATAEK